jgi:hypothetical protein
MKLPLLRHLFVALIALTFSYGAFAQCTYRLEMSDSAGDGWIGGELTITNGTFIDSYTLDGFNDDGADSTVFFQVTPGVTLKVEWVPGFFGNAEVSYRIFNAANVLIEQATNPVFGVQYEALAVCPPCAIPTDVAYEAIFDNRARIKWTSGASTQTGTSWEVIHNPGMFTPTVGIGDTIVVTQPRVTISGLAPDTDYSFYIRQKCTGNTESILIGPFKFRTKLTNDVGVTALITPQSDCDLGVEIIRFNMTNFGSNPQTLIPYTFFINGAPGGVPQPEDGYYTGVIGRDSTEEIEFETTYDFSEPGEYEITVITQMEGDDDPSNDTLVYYINNILEAPFRQTFENWNGGWSTSTDPLVVSSWEWGVPNAPIISSAGEGQKAWVTNLTGPSSFLENSTLTSTCYDFSELTIDPSIRLKYNTQFSEFSGGLALESSIDNGLTWQPVGQAGEGLNWYNGIDNNTQNDSWIGESTGWIQAQHRLNGLAGESNVLFRFVFNNGFFDNVEGAGVDDIEVLVPGNRDLSIAAVSTSGDVGCGLQNDKLTATVVNLGAQAVAPPIRLAYSVNGGIPIEQSFLGNTLLSDENFTVTFTLGFDSRDVLNVIKCWPVLANDANTANDTFTYILDNRPRPVPFRENFESSLEIPDGWNILAGNVVFVAENDAHNNNSRVLAINLYSGNPTFTYELPRYGVIDANDSLRFDYRITQWSAGVVPQALTGGTKFETQISTDCGQTFVVANTINSLNHTPTPNNRTRKVPLAQFAGQNIIIRIVGTWGTGDFWFDLDNIGIIACNTTMGLSADVINTQPGTSNGSATVQVSLGNPPYQYNWSTGATTQTTTGLAIGTYTVSVSDSNGCSDVLEVNIGNVSTDDLPGLSQLAVRPNPTTGLLYVDVQFEQAVDLEVQVVNLLGQTVWSAQPGITAGLSEAIDLSRQTPGLYLLRVVADGQAITKKVILNR